MHASVRRIRTHPGKAAEVGALIDAEYVPMIEGSETFVSYTLIDLGDDEVCSVGVFSTPEGAESANATAKSWTADRLASLVASPLDVAAGTVLVDRRTGGS